jgi:hypothetical protein
LIYGRRKNTRRWSARMGEIGKKPVGDNGIGSEWVYGA